ncbi:MAG TPA: hypothetical protein VJU87_07960 [Gemmatimonadaceae bacterium]|nr:hypothetical protein [Gemmatimonadaceae bacterium]
MGDPLEPVLRETEDELQRRLREACDAEAQGISSVSATEIRRLEDALLAAAAAAEQTLALRRRIERRKVAPPESPGAVAPGTETLSEEQQRSTARDLPPETPFRVREFRDSTGQCWRAWPVIPGQARGGRTAERYLGEFHKGWICFEALEGSARRRLPQQPPAWSELDDSELARLLEQAISAPERKPRPGGSSGPRTEGRS